MSQVVYIPSTHSPRLRGSALKKDWNEFQHLSTQGRYIEPKIFSGFQNQRIKLTTAKKQLYNPRLPTIRHIERDEVLCRLSDEHCRHTTLFTEEQFQNIDPKREESLLEFSGLNWHNTGKALLGVHESPFIQNTSSMEFDARIRADKSQKDSRPSQTKLYRSSSLNSASHSARLTKSIKYTYPNHTSDQNRNTRFLLSARNSNRPTEKIFRSSSMYADTSATSWSPTGHNDGSKSTRV